MGEREASRSEGKPRGGAGEWRGRREKRDARAGGVRGEGKGREGWTGVSGEEGERDYSL